MPIRNTSALLTLFCFVTILATVLDARSTINDVPAVITSVDAHHVTIPCFCVDPSENYTVTINWRRTTGNTDDDVIIRIANGSTRAVSTNDTPRIAIEKDYSLSIHSPRLSDMAVYACDVTYSNRSLACTDDTQLIVQETITTTSAVLDLGHILIPVFIALAVAIECSFLFALWYNLRKRIPTRTNRHGYDGPLVTKPGDDNKSDTKDLPLLTEKGNGKPEKTNEKRNSFTGDSRDSGFGELERVHI